MTDSIHSSSDGTIQSSLADRTRSTSSTPPSPNRGNNGVHGSATTPQKKHQNSNIFSLMMTGSSGKKKRKRNQIAGSKQTKSRFVECPVCGNHIVPHEMNKHLDACLSQQEKQKQKLESEQRKLTTPLHSLDTNNVDKGSLCISTPTATGGKVSKSVPTSTTNVCSPEGTGEKKSYIVVEDEREHHKRDEAETEKCNTDDSTAQKDIFAHMMKRSMKVFSEKEAPTSSPKLLQQMHLHKDGTVSLTCYKIKNAVESRDDIAWSATVQVRGKKETATPAIVLLISSSIPSFGSNASTPQIQQERQRLVRKHSRLSVPVLKSILQKSIRRRKPLPSVRVASELADKSLGDLLRRLPIIILEDSTLHPSFPFLVWLMMADSKNYHLPLFLLKRVLGIVFEMASCRWQDSLKVHEQQKINHNDESTTDIPSELTLACLHNYKTVSKFSDDNALSTQSGTEFCLSNDELIVWSILMRGQYGGMACDIKMLKGYAALWHQRFFSIQTIPEKTKKLLSPHGPCPSITTSDEIVLEKWSQVPAFVHQSAAKQSASRIDRLLMATPMGSFSRPQSQKSAQNKNNNFVGLISLGKSDLTVEGVDFHCSSILESAILSNPKVVEDCCDHLEAIDRKYGHGNSSTGNDQRTRSLHSSLRGVLKSCMWKYSAGVNLRLPLLRAGGSKEDKREGVNDLKQFYENVIKPRTKAFAERYVEDRLSR